MGRSGSVTRAWRGDDEDEENVLDAKCALGAAAMGNGGGVIQKLATCEVRVTGEFQVKAEYDFAVLRGSIQG